jgi:large subunit ribosomal protein L13
MKTSILPVQAPSWHIIDAKEQSLGRVAAAAAHMLRGKNKTSFSPHQLCGDHVVVINMDHLAVENRKLQQKEYVKHSGYLGHLKATPLRQMLAKDPAEVLRLAVYGMLPRNKLRNEMLKRLHAFRGAEHDHQAQQPAPLTVS